MLHFELRGGHTGDGTIVGSSARIRHQLARHLEQGPFVVAIAGRIVPRSERVSFRIEAGSSIELRSVDPKRDRARHYHLSNCRSLFGELALLITWGRIGRPPRARIETFESLAELTKRRTELLARRRAHGYVEHPASSTINSHHGLISTWNVGGTSSIT
jgi:predicted DNA-binding WGR domain protein